MGARTALHRTSQHIQARSPALTSPISTPRTSITAVAATSSTETTALTVYRSCICAPWLCDVPVVTESLQSVPRAGYEGSTAEGTCICTALHDITQIARLSSVVTMRRELLSLPALSSSSQPPSGPHPFNAPILSPNPSSAIWPQLVPASAVYHAKACLYRTPVPAAQQYSASRYSTAQCTTVSYSCTNIQPAHTLR